MSDKKADEKILRDIDEAEAAVYKQIFGIFDKESGDFIKIESEKTAKEIENPKQKKEETKPEIKDEVEQIIRELSEKEISSMVITIKIDGIIEEYVNNKEAGEKYLSKEDQLEKIQETVKGFKNIVIVHSEEELQKLQEDFKMKQEKTKSSDEKSVDNKHIENKPENSKESLNESEVKTQVYIRISEDDYKSVKDIIEKENIKIMANKVKTRDDKSGINMVIKSVDADTIRNILKQNEIPVLQDVDGNIDWYAVKERSNRFEDVTVEQLRDFQNKNNDKYDYVAFRNGNKYTVFADKKCDISIGSSGRKTLKSLEKDVESYRNNNSAAVNTGQKIKGKNKNIKEAVR